MRDKVQQAALRMLLSLSDKHLTTESAADLASGCPILPSSSKAISLILADLFFSSDASSLTTYSLTAVDPSSSRSKTSARMNP